MVDAPRLGVLASGRGSNFVAVLDAHVRGDLPAPTAVVISNNSGAGALDHARKAGILAVHISGKTHEDVGAAILACLLEHDVGVVVLAGYMKLLDPRILSRFDGRVVNIHPAPLPRFGGKGMYGIRVHEAVLAAGVATSGPTVHLCSGAYDEGPILGHTPVPIMPEDTPDTLAERVLEAEHDLYWRVIRDRFC